MSASEQAGAEKVEDKEPVEKEEEKVAPPVQKKTKTIAKKKEKKAAAPKKKASHVKEEEPEQIDTSQAVSEQKTAEMEIEKSEQETPQGDEVAASEQNAVPEEVEQQEEEDVQRIENDQSRIKGVIEFHNKKLARDKQTEFLEQIDRIRQMRQTIQMNKPKSLRFFR